MFTNDTKISMTNQNQDTQRRGGQPFFLQNQDIFLTAYGGWDDTGARRRDVVLDYGREQ